MKFINMTYFNDKSSQSARSKTDRIKRAETLLKINEYKSALKLYNDLARQYPEEASIWYAIVLCLTKKFSDYSVKVTMEPNVNLIKCNECLEKYKTLETDEDLRQKNVQKFVDYEEKVKDIYINTINEYKSNGKKRALKYLLLLIVFSVMVCALVLIVFLNYSS